MRSLSIAVVGLGIMGAATCWRLAEVARTLDADIRITGFDGFSPPHTRGSSHGSTRSVRYAYGEGAGYMPLLTHARDLWHRLEHATQEQLLLPSPNITLARPDSALYRATARVAAMHGVEVHALSAAQVAERFPALQPPPELAGLLEPHAAIARVEPSLHALLHAARNALPKGLTLHTHMRVHFIERARKAIRLHHELGTERFDRVVLCAGPWTARLLHAPGLALPPAIRPVPRRVAVHWFDPPAHMADHFAHPHLPVNFWQPDDETTFYTLPPVQNDGPTAGIKASLHTTTGADPDDPDRTVHPHETKALREVLAAYVPALADAPLRHAATCLYSLFPNRTHKRFRIGPVPGTPGLFAALGFSGHGFKFAPAVGDLLAAHALGTTPPPVNADWYALDAVESVEEPG